MKETGRTRLGNSRADAGEMLEPRRLLAGIESGVLVARGTGGDDVITLIRAGADDVIVTTNGASQAFDMDTFAGIRLLGLGGRDILRVTETIPEAVTLDGGALNDTLVADSGNVRRMGGDGIDLWEYTGTAALIDMRNTPDIELLHVFSETVREVIGNSLDNGINASSLFRSPGVTLRGLGGDDALTGSQGNDRLEGGDGNDLISGEGGDDTVVGNAGNDTLEGGSGNDFADGGPGMNRHREVERFAAGGQPTVRILETRILLATGTGGADTMSIARDGVDDVIVRVNALVGRFDMDDFNNVLLAGLDGNDTITARGELLDGETFHVLEVQGGNGNDNLTGALIRGGAGNDRLAAVPAPRAGGSQLFGDAGDDFLDTANGIPGDAARGGDGFDTARVDGGDTTNGIDRFATGSGTVPTIGLNAGLLLVGGTGGGDTITLERTGVDNVIVRAGALTRDFDLDDVRSIRIRGAAGNDAITVLDPILNREFVMEGGDGDDTITGSDGDLGNDRLIGGRGEDFLFGDDGSDFLDVRDGAPGDAAFGGVGPGTDTGIFDTGDDVNL